MVIYLPKTIAYYEPAKSIYLDIWFPIPAYCSSCPGVSMSVLLKRRKSEGMCKCRRLKV